MSPEHVRNGRENDMEADATITRTLAVCGDARVSVSNIDDRQIDVSVYSEDGCSQSSVYLSLDAAEELAEQIRQHVAEARDV